MKTDDLFNNIVPNKFKEMNEEVDGLRNAYERAKSRYVEKIKDLEKSNKEAAKVIVLCCASFSRVVSKQVHDADFDANVAGGIVLLPYRKKRLRRRLRKRNMTNS